jgi:hypothetical protein
LSWVKTEVYREDAELVNPNREDELLVEILVQMINQFLGVGQGNLLFDILPKASTGLEPKNRRNEGVELNL